MPASRDDTKNELAEAFKGFLRGTSHQLVAPSSAFSVMYVLISTSLAVYTTTQDSGLWASGHEKGEETQIQYGESARQIWFHVLCCTALKIRIKASEDPISLLCRFGEKVMLMSFSVVVMRCALHPFDEYATMWTWTTWLDRFWLLAALLTLICGYDFRCSCEKQSWIDNRDVGLYITIALVLSTAAMGAFHMGWRGDPGGFLSLYLNYIEIMIFMPAVQMLMALDRNLDVFSPIEDQELSGGKRKAISFCLFLCGFSLSEDIVIPTVLYVLGVGLAEPMLISLYVIHFVAQWDLVAIFLVHVFDAGAGKKRDLPTKMEPVT